MTTSRTLDVPGARLHYEVGGSGPVVLVVGSPMGAEPFAPLADALAVDHTVVTHDPRGISGSRLDDPDEETTVEQRADDVAAVLDALRVESADMFGSSGGAVTGLALVHSPTAGVRRCASERVGQLTPCGGALIVVASALSTRPAVAKSRSADFTAEVASVPT